MKRKQISDLKKIITIIIVIAVSIGTYFGIDIFGDSGQATYITNGENAEIHYLDVGQGDAIYLKVNNQNILIDAGPKDESENLVKQLKDLKVESLDMVIATHPHEDHIGGMVKIFNNFKVNSFYMPKVTHTSKTFTNMMDSVNKAGLKIQTLKADMTISLGEGSEFKVYSPISSAYNELNDYSPIMKLIYGNTSLMFTGDAEVLSENEVLNKYSASELKCDVLKVGHHGSTTSSSNEFLNAVNPKTAVISVGAGNSYGHPHKEIMNKIQNKNIDIYRTDVQGQITITSDGNNLNISSQK